MRKIILCFLFIMSITISSCASDDKENDPDLPDDLIPVYDEIGFFNRPEYQGIYTERTPEVQPCQGGLYREASSSQEAWLGIEATLVLPDFVLSAPSEQGNHDSDYATIYFGSKSGLITKVGLMTNTQNEDSFVSYRIWGKGVSEAVDFKLDFGDSSNYHYYPGDKIRMSLFSPKENTLQFIIELLENTTNPIYSGLRKDLTVFYSELFHFSNHFVSDALFQRGISLKSLNEGQQPPTSSIIDLVWESVYLYKIMGTEVYKFPLAGERVVYSNCPFSNQAIFVDYLNLEKSIGGERVSINYTNR